MLALAIQNEEEDGRIYRDFVERLRDDYPASAKVFEEMADEENGHRQMLIDLFRERFGEHIPLIRRDDVRGFIRRQPVWMTPDLRHRRHARARRNRWRRKPPTSIAAPRRAPPTPAVRKLLGDLADIEAGHEAHARALTGAFPQTARDEESETARRNFVLRIVQPGLVGLMDGSVSTLAPVFAAAFATHNSWDTFLVGMAASIGAGISMGFAEALSDDGTLSGRGQPWLRGLVTGLMTTVGGVGHTLPYLIGDRPQSFPGAIESLSGRLKQLLGRRQQAREGRKLRPAVVHRAAFRHRESSRPRRQMFGELGADRHGLFRRARRRRGAQIGDMVDQRRSPSRGRLPRSAGSRSPPPRARRFPR